MDSLWPLLRRSRGRHAACSVELDGAELVARLWIARDGTKGFFLRSNVVALVGWPVAARLQSAPTGKTCVEATCELGVKRIVGQAKHHVVVVVVGE